MGKPITVPIALSCTVSASLTSPWFVQKGEYKPAPATFKPLVNGEEAFGAIYDAIMAARHSIEIACWGFQPSMYFKRGGDHGLMIGELLALKGAQGKKVRLLCWMDDMAVTQWSENMQPGNNAASAFKNENRNSAQREFDRAWYQAANRSNVTRRGVFQGVSSAMLNPAGAAFNVGSTLYHSLKGDQAPIPNFEFATRDFSMIERCEIAYRTAFLGEDGERSTWGKIENSASMAAIPTHHQKMVLIDYEDPDAAIGFVMGHNTLDAYWDTDKHSYMRMHPAMGHNDFHPRQDMSSRVSGPILQYLNDNFCEAWDLATGQTLGRMRERWRCTHRLRSDLGDTPVMAQIARTQSQNDGHSKHGTRDIEAMYLQAVRNASNFIYIENQYFRWPPLAEQIRKTVIRYQSDGRESPLYLFVVTNSSDDGVGKGTVNTYRMLDALGRDDAMSGVAKLEKIDGLQKQHDALEQQAQQLYSNATQLSGYNAGAVSAVTSASEALRQVQVKQATVDRQMQQIKDLPKDAPMPAMDIPGLKVHVCTLVAPDAPASRDKKDPWSYVYVHAKAMIVDDVFTTLGSANINTRSMESDSELNIFHERGDVTRPLREKLWDMHTNGMGVGKDDASGRLDTDDAFKKWTVVVNRNADRQDKNLAPYASLVQFRRDDPKRTNLD